MKWGVEGMIENKEGLNEGMEGTDEGIEMWGWTEEMGWKQKEDVGLIDLGEIAEGRYRLNVQPGEDGTKQCVCRD